MTCHSLLLRSVACVKVGGYDNAVCMNVVHGPVVPRADLLSLQRHLRLQPEKRTARGSFSRRDTRGYGSLGSEPPRLHEHLSVVAAMEARCRLASASTMS